MASDPNTSIQAGASPNTPARGRVELRALLIVAATSSAIVGLGAFWAGYVVSERSVSRAEDARPAPARYRCLMHPAVVQDHPGDCPICGMKLVRGDDPPGHPADRGRAAGAPRILFYRSPMNPKVTSPTPMKDEMGMDFVPVYEADAGAPAAGEGTTPGLATVDIDPARQQLIGLTTAEATRGPVGGAWRTVGRVATDETRVRHVNVKVNGFVERVFVDFVGKPVRAGDPLFTVYSPDLLSAQEEYLLALRTRGALASGGALAGDGDALVRAARKKLSLWDVPDAEIERIAQTGQTTKTLTFYSPVSGVVTKKDVVEGMKLEAGAMPYEIVDLSSVWVLADVYENELRSVKEGMPATLTLNAFPGRQFKGKVLFVNPLLDPQTRTVKVRLAFPNPTGDLRPEMFGEVVLHGKPRQGLRIPEDAVLDSGTEKIVFVALGDGKFQPRKVELGDSSGSDVEVVSGLKERELVVTRANFLVDSESKLRASLAAPSASKKAPQSARVLPGSAGAEHDGTPDAEISPAEGQASKPEDP